MSNDTKIKCSECKKLIHNETYIIKSNYLVFCCVACQFLYIWNKAERKPPNKPVITPVVKKVPKHINYRKLAFSLLPNQCLICGYKTIKNLLDVDHINCNREDNRIQNLQILCVMCHAMKTRGIIIQSDIDRYIEDMQYEHSVTWW